MWEQPSGSAEKSFIDEDDKLGKKRSRASTDVPPGDGPEGEKTRRKQVAELLAPSRYHQRWSYVFRSGRDYRSGGIPLEELERSAFIDPGTGKPWLLHRKCFRLEKQGDVFVACRDQKVPICQCCRSALSGKTPQMPKFALANDPVSYTHLTLPTKDSV